MAENNGRTAIECACSRTGKKWTAVLECQGRYWIYVHHYLPEEIRILKKQRDKEELVMRMKELGGNTASMLPPPPQVEIVPKLRPAEIESAKLSQVGFECPYCKEMRPLSCCACGGVSCQGTIDAAQRTVCVRCGATLQFGRSNLNAQPFQVGVLDPAFVARITELSNPAPRKLIDKSK